MKEMQITRPQNVQRTTDSCELAEPEHLLWKLPPTAAVSPGREVKFYNSLWLDRIALYTKITVGLLECSSCKMRKLTHSLHTKLTCLPGSPQLSLSPSVCECVCVHVCMDYKMANYRQQTDIRLYFLRHINVWLTWRMFETCLIIWLFVFLTLSDVA